MTLEVRGKGKSWEMPFVEVFDLLGYRSRRSEEWEGYPRGREDTEERNGELVEGRAHLSSEDCAVEDQM